MGLEKLRLRLLGPCLRNELDENEVLLCLFLSKRKITQAWENASKGLLLLQEDNLQTSEQLAAHPLREPHCRTNSRQAPARCDREPMAQQGPAPAKLINEFDWLMVALMVIYIYALVTLVFSVNTHPYGMVRLSHASRSHVFSCPIIRLLAFHICLYSRT